MPFPELKTDIDGEDLIQEKLTALQAGADPQYVIAALTKTLLNKSEYLDTSRPGRSPQVITLNKDVHPFTFGTYMQSQGVTDDLRSVFNTFNNAQLTSLTPMIKFFLRGDKTKEIIPIPLQNVHNSLSPEGRALSSVNRKYSYLGIKQIDIELAGNSPEVAKSDIQSSVTFYGNNLSLFEKDGQGEHYLPLIVPYYTRKNSKGQQGNQYQLLMQVGWNIPSPSTRRALNFSKTQMKAITAQQVTYVMRYYKHGFSFNVDGSFQLKVDYISAVDEALKDVNLMEPSLKDVEAFLVSDGGSETSEDAKKTKPSPEQVSNAISDFIKVNLPSSSGEAKEKVVNFLKGKPSHTVLKEIEKLEKKFSKRDSSKIKSIISKLITAGLGYRIELSPAYVDHLYFDIVSANYMDEFFNQAKFVGGQRQQWLEETRKKTISTPKSEIESDFKISGISAKAVDGEKPKPKKKSVWSFFDSPKPGTAVAVYNFFKLGDILSAFLAASNGEKYFKNQGMKLILGNIRFPAKVTSAGNAKTNMLSTSLYDIPITVESLQQVMQDHYISTTKKRLTFQSFVSALLTNVVKPYYMEKDLIMDHRPAKGTITTGQCVAAGSAAKKLQDGISESALKTLNLREARVELKNSGSGLTMFYYVNICSPSPPITPKVMETFDSYHVGSTSSIVKRVSFNQANSAVQQARADDNVVASLRNEDSVIIPQVYNVAMDVVGNVNFYPGYSFHLHPTMLGLSQDTKDSVLKTLGLTGTYMSTKVSHSFTMEGFTTSLDSYNVYVDKKNSQAADPQSKAAQKTTG